MGQPPYEAVLFDFDGVLVDSEPVHFECWREILAPHGLKLDWETYSSKWIGVADREMLAGMAAQCNPPLELSRLLEEYPKKKSLFRERMIAGNPVSDDVRELINELTIVFKLAIVTSSGRTEVEPILEATGISGLFSAHVYGGDVREPKPAPEPYLLACERLGSRNALVVEDSAAGLESARRAGLDVVRVTEQRAMPSLVRARLRSAGSITSEIA